MYLPQGTILHNRYVIESLLGHGGFGITYAAHDQVLKVRVAVKEYLPRQLATRGEGQTQVSVYSGEARQQYDYGLRKFMEEAQSVARFAHHPNVVSARDYFAANGTAYMVMEYVEGVTLKEYLGKKGGRISFEEARGIMMPVMDALREVHQAGMLHRDISPDNIYITTSAQVKILDFGAARYYTGEQSKSLSVILKSGYAPEEQYRSSGKQGAWTDVYAVGATLYKALTGKTPPDALDRLAEDTLTPPSRLGVAISPEAEQALLQALAVNAGRRLQSMGEFQQALLGNVTMTMGFQSAAGPLQPAPESSFTPAPPPVHASPAAPPSPYLPRRSVNPAAIAAAIGGGVIGLILVVVVIMTVILSPTMKEYLGNLMFNPNQAALRQAEEQRRLDERRQEERRRAEQERRDRAKQEEQRRQDEQERREAEQRKAREAQDRRDAEQLKTREEQERRDAEQRKAREEQGLAQKEATQNAMALYKSGIAYSNQGQYQKAIAAYLEVVKIRPESVGAFFNIGLAYEKLGQYQEAIKAFKQVTVLEPKHTLARYNLALAYNVGNEKKLAMEEYIILKNQDPQLANKLLRAISNNSAKR
jgi:serine/threonine protein kinase/Flp pilus assembly protein TadD